ncbi:hypothetical protein [Hoeflea halophila]|nr:hypothetical protein [Hoeflea halophila]
MSLGLAGCETASSTIKTSDEISPLNYRVPGKDVFSQRLDDAFACMKATGALENQGFAIGPFANDTGKTNSATNGGTGSFLPAGPNIAIYAVEAVSQAGGIAYDYSNMEVVRNIAFVGGESAAHHMHKLQNANMPNFAINVFATALDFGGVNSADVRVAGVGPIMRQTKANAYYGAHIFQPGSQRSLARGFAVFQADYTEVGIGANAFVGGGSGTLVSGVLSMGSQEPLQRPSAEGIMVATAYALLEIPALQSCRSKMLPFEGLNASPQQLRSSVDTGLSATRPVNPGQVHQGLGYSSDHVDAIAMDIGDTNSGPHNQPLASSSHSPRTKEI